MPFLQTAPTPLFYDVRGDVDAPPLLILGGLGDSSRSWEMYVQYFSQFHRVVICDHRDAGQSPRFETPYSIADIADDYVGLLDELKIDSCAVLGFSMGGKVSLELSRIVPARITRMILVSTSIQTVSDDLIQKIVPESLGTVEQREIFFERQFELLFSQKYRARYPAKQFVKYKLLEPHPQTLQSFRNQLQALRRFSISDRELQNVQVPCLILAGDDDPLFTISSVNHLAKNLPQAQLNIYLGAGHVLQADEPLRFREDVIRFLNDQNE